LCLPLTNLVFRLQGGSGGGSGGAGGDDRIVMEDSVFVSGLPVNVTESEIEVFFGSIGVIKVQPT